MCLDPAMCECVWLMIVVVCACRWVRSMGVCGVVGVGGFCGGGLEGCFLL